MLLSALSWAWSRGCPTAPSTDRVMTFVDRPRVVIAGGGFGGLSAARALARVAVDVTLIDRHNYHLFQPLLYQVATAALAPNSIAAPIRAILRGQRNATVLMETVTGIDTAGRAVLIGEQRVAYDFLIIATGARHSYFGHDEWEKFAPGIKTLFDALSIRQQVLSAFEAAEVCNDSSERRRLLNFILIGAGPTGVELAGAIAELAKASLAHHPVGGWGRSAARREVAGHTCRPSGTRGGARRSIGSGIPRDICGRRHLLFAELGWKAGAERRSCGKANGGLCRERDQGAHREGCPAAAIHLPPSRQPCNHRAQQCGGGFGLDNAHWVVGLAGLECRPYFLPDRLPLAHRRSARLVVGLCHLPPRSSDHSRREHRRDRKLPVGAAGGASVKLEDHPTIRRISEQVKEGQKLTKRIRRFA